MLQIYLLWNAKYIEVFSIDFIDTCDGKIDEIDGVGMRSGVQVLMAIGYGRRLMISLPIGNGIRFDD
jgi:hypothetical protein